MPGTTHDQPEDVSQAVSISNAIVHLMREYTGRGPTKTRTHFHDDLITVVLRDSLTKGERSLVRDGLEDMVLTTRKPYQGTMRDELVTSVEQITGRTVAAFLSDNHRGSVIDDTFRSGRPGRPPASRPCDRPPTAITTPVTNRTSIALQVVQP